MLAVVDDALVSVVGTMLPFARIHVSRQHSHFAVVVASLTPCHFLQRHLFCDDLRDNEQKIESESRLSNTMVNRPVLILEPNAG